MGSRSSQTHFPNVAFPRAVPGPNLITPGRNLAHTGLNEAKPATGEADEATDGQADNQAKPDENQRTNEVHGISGNKTTVQKT